MTGEPRRGVAPQPVLVVGAGSIVAFLFGALFSDFVRNDLHFLCSFVRMGADDPGDWACQDGISYIGVAVATQLVIIAVSALALLVVLLRAWHRTARFTARHRGVPRLLVPLVLLPSAYVLLSTPYAVSTAIGSAPDAWWSAFGAASIVLAVGLASAVVVAITAARRVVAIGTALVALSSIGAAIAQPGVLFVSALILAGAAAVAADARDAAPPARANRVFA